MTQWRKVAGLGAVLGAAGLAALPAYMAYQQGPPERAKKKREEERRAPGSMWGQMNKGSKAAKAPEEKEKTSRTW